MGLTRPIPGLWKQKPEPWGPVDAVQFAVRRWFEDVLGVDGREVINFIPFWEKTGVVHDYGRCGFSAPLSGDVAWSGADGIRFGGTAAGALQFPYNPDLSFYVDGKNKAGFSVFTELSKQYRTTAAQYSPVRNILGREYANVLLLDYLYSSTRPYFSYNVAGNSSFGNNGQITTTQASKFSGSSLLFGASVFEDGTGSFNSVDGVLHTPDTAVDNFNEAAKTAFPLTFVGTAGYAFSVGLYVCIHQPLSLLQHQFFYDNPYAAIQPYSPPIISIPAASGGGSFRQLLANISGASVTPSVSAVIARAISSTIQGTSATPAVSATISRAVSASPHGDSITPDVDADVLRALTAAITGNSLTPSITVSMARALAASVIGQSVTPNITAVISGIIMLAARISGVSITGDITAVCDRRIAANISGQSATSTVSASILRAVAASIAGASVTPNITGSLTNLIALSASIQGISITSAAAVTISRAITSSINGASTTQTVTATTVRALLANIQAESITPEDLVMILGGLGIILSPGIRNMTVRYEITNKTIQRAIRRRVQ